MSEARTPLANGKGNKCQLFLRYGVIARHAIHGFAHGLWMAPISGLGFGMLACAYQSDIEQARLFVGCP